MNSPVKVNVSAKAEAKLSIRGEVPSSSMGRLVDSITDIFRPFSEARGLRADHIRMQREEVAIEIAKRARERLAIENAEVRPVDNKILIPLIEKASLEDSNDEEMIDRWSALLANASKNQKVEPRYVQILSELTSRQAKLFEAIATNAMDEFQHPRAWLEDAPVHLDSPWIRKQINDIFVERKTKMSAEFIYDKIFEYIDIPGSTVIDIILSRSDDTFYSLPPEAFAKNRYDKYELDLEILSSLGLVKRVSIHYATKFKDDIQVIYYHLTELCVAFFLSVDRNVMASEEPTK